VTGDPPDRESSPDPMNDEVPTHSPYGAVLAMVLALMAFVALLAGIVMGERLGLEQDTGVSKDVGSGSAEAATAAAGITSGITSGAASGGASGAAASQPDTAGLSTGIVEPGRASLGEPAPDFTLEAPDGSTVKLSDFAGRPVILNFWATWCAPCQIEMPYLQAAHTEHADKGLVVLGVNVGEQTSVVQPYLEERSLTFPVALDLNSRVSDLYRVFSFPTTYLIDRDGRVINIRRGVFADQADIDQSVSLILPEATE
jgi:peroxiredoxin